MRPYLPLVMGLAVLAATVGGARGHSPSAAAPAPSVVVAAAPAGAPAAEAAGAAPAAASGAAAQTVAAPEVPAVPDRVGYPVLLSRSEQAVRAASDTVRQLAAAPPVAVPPAPAHGATGRRAPPRSA